MRKPKTVDGNSPNDGRGTDPRDQEQRAPAESHDPVRTDTSDDSNQRQEATGGEGSNDSRASGREGGGRSRQGQGGGGGQGQGRNSRQGRGGQRNRGGRGRRRQRGPEGGGNRQSNDRQDDGRNDDVELASPDDSLVELLGILEVLGSGSGFIRRREAGYTPSNEDIYVGAKVIQKFGLRAGDELTGSIGPKPKSGKSPRLTHLALVNAKPPDDAKRRPDFNRLSAVHPSEQLVLACDRMIGGQPDYTNRVIDLFCPLGKGQRAMIVAPSKAGKTTVLQSVAEGVVTNNPDIRLMILLADERPEEITDMEMCGFGEVIASSFDRPAERHCQVAEMTLERARRYVESGEDVVIILDSITRLARAYNTVEEGSGRTLSGGLDANSLEKPKRFIGSARKIDPRQGGGSLTIVATALVDTGSRMDQVIFEEFKGTGNSELVLSRELADKRIYPAIDLNQSATRKEELLLDADSLSVSRAMRRQLADVSPADAMTELLGVMGRTRTNEGLVAIASQKI
jgi:transcription termination factor Rho